MSDHEDGWVPYHPLPYLRLKPRVIVWADYQGEGGFDYQGFITDTWWQELMFGEVTAAYPKWMVGAALYGVY